MVYGGRCIVFNNSFDFEVVIQPRQQKREWGYQVTEWSVFSVTELFRCCRIARADSRGVLNMAGGVSSVVLPVFFGMFAMQAWTLEIIDVDMTGPGCSNSKEQVLSGSEVYSLHANSLDNQPFYAGCNVTVRASQSSQYLHYTVRQFSVSSDCGVSLWIFENPQNGNTPSRMLTCRDSKTLPVQGSSSTQGKLRFTVLRDVAQNSIFQLQIQVTASLSPGYVEIRNKAYAARLTDSGSNADSSNDPTPTNNEGEGGGGLNGGVLVGIGIAAVILIIAVVGLIIYCCLRNRNQELKDAEACEGRSGTSVFTSGTSQVLFAGGNNQRKNGGGGKYGSMEDIRSSSSTDRANNLYSNKGYHADGDEEISERDPSSRHERGGYKNTAFADEADRAVERGGHLSRKDSGRGVKYDKKKNFSRHEEYEMSKVSKVPNGILKQSRSKSPNRSQSSTEGSTVDSNAMVYGYSQTAHAHPNTQHIPVLERTRSRSRSRGTSSHRSGSAGRSRSGSVGKSSGKDMAKAPKSARQYSDMSHFLEKPKERPRSRSGSVGRRSRSDSKTSDHHTPSEVSFAPSGASSKKNTGGRRVHIQGVETDF